MRKVFWLVFLSLFVSAGMVFAQGITGTISGTLKDRNDALIPNARVEVINEADGTIRPVYTDLRGRYSVVSLSPGSYRVAGTDEGFKDNSKSGVAVTAGKQTVVDLQLLGEAPDGGTGGKLRPGSVTIPPFRIVGNIYYVGLNDTASFLITTPQGNILIDADFASSPPYIRENIEQLGFKMRDIKILLFTHEHPDHVGGMAQMKEETGAQLFAMQGADTVLEDGGRTGFPNNSGKEQFTPVKVDKVLHDQEKVQLGGTTLVANLTAGHTKGCTSWSTVAEEKGKKYNVVILCSSSLNANIPLINNKDFPNISDALAAGFKRLKSLPCDIPLGSHERFYNMLAKMELLRENPTTNPFIDPEGYKAYVDMSEKSYLAQLARQRGGEMPKKND